MVLASIVVSAVALYILYRVVRYRYLRFQSLSQILAKAKENTNFLENVRAIRAIKIFGREAERQSIWQNFYSATINTGFRVNRINIFFTLANGFLFGIEARPLAADQGRGAGRRPAAPYIGHPGLSASRDRRDAGRPVDVRQHCRQHHPVSVSLTENLIRAGVNFKFSF